MLKANGNRQAQFARRSKGIRHFLNPQHPSTINLIKNGVLDIGAPSRRKIESLQSKQERHIEDQLSRCAALSEDKQLQQLLPR